MVLWFELRAYTLSYSTSPFLWWVFFKIGFCRTLSLDDYTFQRILWENESTRLPLRSQGRELATLTLERKGCQGTKTKWVSSSHPRLKVTRRKTWKEDCVKVKAKTKQSKTPKTRVVSGTHPWITALTGWGALEQPWADTCLTCNLKEKKVRLSIQGPGQGGWFCTSYLRMTNSTEKSLTTL
jgi:hypothetical protein